MNVIQKIAIATLGLVPMMGFSQTITVDVKSNVHAISPYIYGSNEDCSFTTSARWGGNRSTSYNWENNASNGGNDYSNISDAFYDYSQSKTPALPIVNFVKNADMRNQFKIVSLPAAGYVAADKNGVVMNSPSEDNPRWKKLAYEKPTPYTFTPDTSDAYVYVDELVNYLMTLGEPGNGGVDAYAVDNEPFLWSQTHPILHPEQTTYKELLEKTKLVAQTVHKQSPNTEIVGPMFYGWTDACRWGSDAILKSLRAQNNDYRWFVDFYLDSLRQMEEQDGQKYLDIISFHWYPEARGTETKLRIVNTSTADAATPAELTAVDMIEARLQAPRSLWDNTYRENSYVGTEMSQYIPKSRRGLLNAVKYSINTYKPGTKIAFTEFEYDAEWHWSGGLALVDVLGIFGREDVYLATKWDKFQSYSEAAYKLYLNYDGNGGAFGTTSVQDIFTDTVKLASYASLDDQGNLHIIAINKTNESLPANFVINNGTYTGGIIYGFDQNSATVAQMGTIDEIENGTFSYALPAYSAVHFVLNVVEQTKLQTAQLLENEKITLTFEDAITLADASQAAQEFIVVAGSDTITVANVVVNGNTLELSLNKAIAVEQTSISVSYEGTEVKGKNNLPIDIFFNQIVTNEIATAPLIAMSAEIESVGTYIKLTFSKALAEISGTCGLSVYNGDTALDFSCKKSETSDYELYVYPTSRVVRYEETIISSTDNSVLKDMNGVYVSDFSFSMKGGANYTPTIDSIVIADNFTIKMYFDANMEPTTDYNNAGFHIWEYDSNTTESKELDFMAVYDKTSRELTFTTVPPLLQGRTYTMKYDGNDIVRTIHVGVLEKFEQELENSLTSGGTIVEVPGVIQADEFWFQTGGPVKGVSSDDSELGNGTTLGYTDPGDYYTYFVKVPETKKYTITVRYSAEGPAGYNGQLAFLINGEPELFNITLPKTGSFDTWSEAYRVIDLPQGDSVEFKIKVVNSGFNLNYFSVTDEEKYPEVAITKAYIVKDGNILFMIYDKDITTVVDPTEIVLMADGNRVDVTSYEYVNNDKKKIRYYLDSKIYKNQEVKLSYNTENGESIEGTHLSELVDSLINNNSVLTKPVVAVETLDSDVEFTVVPNPVKVGGQVILSSEEEGVVSYEVFSANGVKIKQGAFEKEMTMQFDKVGTYYVVLQTKNGKVSKQVVVE